ncbi:neuromedin-U isoform 2 precursor [Daubentonia madagascariensis]|uniref:Neuromedin-U isoform 2 n=1 Tax=Daubentonia madagascariensis TaxID=31869 RepID=A0ABD2ELU8_DAUMA
MLRAASRRPGPLPGQVAAASPLLPLLLLACCAGACRGAPILPQGLWPEQELQLWNEASKVLEELCFALTGILLKPREQEEKDNTKRFLFHYSKTQKLDNSNVVSSVVHPLLQLVPQLNERRMKRFRVNEEFQSPFASRSRGYFLFRPRNGRRSAGFI